MAMALAVVFDRMAAPHDLAGEIRMPLHALTHAEKRRGRACRIELRENLRRHRRIRTVVDVMATSPRAPLAAGSRTQFGPRSRLFGQRPAAVSTA